MKALTFSIVAGSLACNARCPFCVAGMTPANGVGQKEPEVNWRNFRKAAQLARDSQCSIAKLTSKGEPTIFPNQITRFLEELEPFNFPLSEIQTNGILIAEGRKIDDEMLKRWYDLGLTTVAISVVHWEPEKNREIYVPHRPEYIDLPALVAKLKAVGFLVRFTTVLVKGYIDSVEAVDGMLAYCREHKVDQLTMIPVTKPDQTEDEGIYNWTAAHAVSQEFADEVSAHLEANGTRLLEYAHGGIIYDVGGQNVCFTNCLTMPKNDEMRHLIFYPDGAVRYAWQYAGARIL
jgi:molybdenum cofactor biosynthesis enzyme MoaA